MKKIYITFLTLLLIIPFSVFASTTPKVLTITAKNIDSEINYTGTTEDGVHAVMCKLFNSDEEEIDMLSSSVDDNSFSGKFTNVSEGKYIVACARYEGGEVKKVDVVVKEVSSTNDNSKNPKTYDAGIAGSIAILVISLTGIVGSTIYLKKKKVKDN